MIIPRSGDFIKHARSMDLAIKIEKTFGLGHKWKIKGDWWNQAFNTSWPLGIRARVAIKTEDLQNWLVCANPAAVCIRNEKWIKLGKDADED